jgi:hypothetical protein
MTVVKELCVWRIAYHTQKVAWSIHYHPLSLLVLPSRTTNARDLKNCVPTQHKLTLVLLPQFGAYLGIIVELCFLKHPKATTSLFLFASFSPDNTIALPEICHFQIYVADNYLSSFHYQPYSCIISRFGNDFHSCFCILDVHSFLLG